MKTFLLFLILAPAFAFAQVSDEWELDGGTLYATKQDCINAALGVGVHYCRPVSVILVTPPPDTPPVLTLNPDSDYTVPDPYVEKGFSCIDAEDGDITAAVVVSGTVDNTTAGTYPVDYVCTDADGNSVNAQRSVLYLDPPNTAPTVNAGADELATVPDIVDLLNGAVCNDAEDGALACQIIDDGGYNNLVAGIYTVTIGATDSGGLSTTDTKIITMQDGPPVNEPGATIQTAQEIIPNPCYGSALRTSVGYLNWQANDCVIVDSVVTLTSNSVVGSIVIYPGGNLTCDPNFNIQLIVTTLLVTKGGAFQCGTFSQPAQAQIIFRDAAFNNDPTQILNGLVSVDGTVKTFGEEREAFYRMLTGINAGATQITLENTATWSVGDKIIIPKSTVCRSEDGSQNCNNQTEEKTIVGISGNTIDLGSAMVFDHPGVGADLPHVINASRSIVFRSENPTGNRGHFMFHGDSVVDIRYSAFLSMGRTNSQDVGAGNQKGRYPLHAHHEQLPYSLIGNFIDLGAENITLKKKWGLTVHHSFGGLIEKNVIYHAYGAGYAQEDRNSQNNAVLNNFVVYVVGGNGERLEDIGSDGTKLGRAGVGFWLNGGQGNTFEGNIAAHVAECVYCYGFKFDNSYNSDYSTGITIKNNEAYAVPNGLTIWWMCIEYETVHNPACSSLVDGFKVWNHNRWGYFGYESYQLTLKNIHADVDADYLQNPFNYINAMWFADYQQQRLVIEDIDAPNLPIDLPSNRGRNCSGTDCGKAVVCGGNVKNINVYVPSSTSSSPSVSDANTFVRGVNYQSINEGVVCWDCGEPQFQKLNAVYTSPTKNCAF